MLYILFIFGNFDQIWPGMILQQKLGIFQKSRKISCNSKMRTETKRCPMSQKYIEHIYPIFPLGDPRDTQRLTFWHDSVACCFTAKKQPKIDEKGIILPRGPPR